MSITETKRVYAGLIGKEPACCPSLVLHTWVALPAYRAYEQVPLVMSESIRRSHWEGASVLPLPVPSHLGALPAYRAYEQVPL